MDFFPEMTLAQFPKPDFLNFPKPSFWIFFQDSQIGFKELQKFMFGQNCCPVINTLLILAFNKGPLSLIN